MRTTGLEVAGRENTGEWGSGRAEKGENGGGWRESLGLKVLTKQWISQERSRKNKNPSVGC